MRKLLILLFGSLIGLPAISQTQLAEVVRLWKNTAHVPVSDGYVYKYMVHDKSDTAIYYKTGIDTFEVTTTFKKISGNKPEPPKPDLVTTVDDNVVTIAQKYDPPTNAGDNIAIAGLWTHFKDQAWNAPHHAKTASVLRTAGYVEVTCTCVKVEWWSELRVNHGIVSISIDGGPAKDVDLYDPRTDNNSILVWTSGNLGRRKKYGLQINATHTVRIAFTGRKNPAATETNYVHDKFVIYTQQP